MKILSLCAKVARRPGALHVSRQASIATTDYDHFRDFRLGGVRAEGIQPTWSMLGHQEIFARFTFNREWDVAELSFAKFCAEVTRKDSDIIGLPVICSRCSGSSFYVSRKSKIKTAKDLKGEKVGPLERAHTAPVYMRGWLGDEHGVRLQDVHWVQAGTNEAGRIEKVAGLGRHQLRNHRAAAGLFPRRPSRRGAPVPGFLGDGGKVLRQDPRLADHAVRQSLRLQRREETENARLARLNSIQSEKDSQSFGATYRITWKDDWNFRRVNLQVRTDHDRNLTLTTDGNGHWRDADGQEILRLRGCFEIDISATLFTNTLAIGQLQLAVGQSADLLAGYIRLPELTVGAVPQRYSCVDLGTARSAFRYGGLFRNFVAVLPVDENLLVVDYPETFRRWTSRNCTGSKPDPSLRRTAFVSR